MQRLEARRCLIKKVKNEFMKKQWMLWSSLVGCSLFLLTACLKNDNTTPSEIGYMSIIQASPDAPGFHIFYNGNELTQGGLFTYPQSSDHYLNLDPGNFQLRFVSNSDTLVAVDDSMQNNNTYSLIVYDSAAAIKSMFLHDNLSGINDHSNQMGIRCLNLAPGSEPVDFYLDTVRLSSGRTFADNVSDPSLGEFTYLDPPTDTVHLIIRSSATGDTLARYPEVFSLRAGVFTFYLRGIPTRTDSLGLNADYFVNL